MKVAKVQSADLGNPVASAWAAVSSEAVSLAPVALAAQPTAYIRESWAGRSYGQTAGVSLAAASDGERLYVRLEWPDDQRPNGEFQDAAGAVFPTNGGGALATLGDAQQPLALWYWEHGRDDALNLVARGPGVFRKDEDGALAARGALADGRWSVVFSGPVTAASKGRIGVAVWNGANDERAGLAAVSQEWLPLELD